MLNLLLFLCVTLNSVAQFFLKLGATRIAEINEKSCGDMVGRLVAYVNIYIVSGFLLFIVASFLWIKVLTLTPLSYAVLFTALSMVLTIVLSLVALREPLPPLRIVGAAIIVIGILLVSYSY